MTVRHIYCAVKPKASLDDRFKALSKIATEMEHVRVADDQKVLIHCRYIIICQETKATKKFYKRALCNEIEGIMIWHSLSPFTFL